jgi:predicted DCC family thiol-disulfide oxidoreductase YuxK
LWDGECGFCREAVGWVKRRDRAGVFKVIAYQDAPSPPMTPELRELCRNALHVVAADGALHGAGMASAFILEHIGYGRLGRAMRWRMVRPIVEWGYRRVANNRRWIGRVVFGKKCNI